MTPSDVCFFCQTNSLKAIDILWSVFSSCVSVVFLSVSLCSCEFISSSSSSSSDWYTCSSLALWQIIPSPIVVVRCSDQLSSVFFCSLGIYITILTVCLLVLQIYSSCASQLTVLNCHLSACLPRLLYSHTHYPALDLPPHCSAPFYALICTPTAPSTPLLLQPSTLTSFRSVHTSICNKPLKLSSVSVCSV